MAVRDDVVALFVCSAYQYDNYGTLENELKIHSDVPQPKLDAHQVRIKVQSAAVNPFDRLVMEGMGQAFLGIVPSTEKPFTIGIDGAGKVVEIGSDVNRLAVDDEVYLMTPVTAFGTLAEYVVAEEEFVAVKPRNLDFNEAAAVPSVALTAYAGMFRHAKLQKDQTVLILGGSSSVGMYAVQFAHALGARVIATTSTRNVELVKSLGADQVIDYTKEKWLEIVEPHSVDAFYDCGAEDSAWNDGAQLVLKKATGRFITISPMAQPVAESKFGAILIGEVYNTDPSADKLDVITQYIESGTVKPVIDTVYPFEKAMDAYAKLKTKRARGKLVLQVHQ
ncbi:hypothetical protein BBO99_00002498 [Phytophthora kernoviae]|uniref:Enoyl reductase (ER) domain-containing protein n=2 Tax=Phytophthora kernoviae TaxID=325452 RepID=A0A3R7KMC2_9STRA|nr:hypothetical protein G195_004618 [Phytophthora kernoviae 00238/432]KAG2526747.1 hypothetical protein JM16_003704 [Phytophthora kernoviae]KAG2530692.1 hypothetical protein JM18_001960 [Phytophthora kernoviae]RLN27254.1 hypothetical protein BBI17_002410 [Phytophthora kernoviae]RLN82998.1 hypothetical protein BBO99_00002498 [Phytophthora kernoviae]